MAVIKNQSSVYVTEMKVQANVEDMASRAVSSAVDVFSINDGQVSVPNDRCPVEALFSTLQKISKVFEFDVDPELDLNSRESLHRILQANFDSNTQGFLEQETSDIFAHLSSTQKARILAQAIASTTIIFSRLAETRRTITHGLLNREAQLFAESDQRTLMQDSIEDSTVFERWMIHSMAFLNRLKHNPTSYSALIPINRMLLVSYFKKRKLTEAMKVFNWMSRPDSPCYPDAMVFGVVISGFCLNGMTLEALRILRAMVGSNVMPGAELRIRVYKSLLREARIKEAQALNEALGSVGDASEGLRKVLELFDHMINNWTD